MQEMTDAKIILVADGRTPNVLKEKTEEKRAEDSLSANQMLHREALHVLQNENLGKKKKKKLQRKLDKMN